MFSRVRVLIVAALLTTFVESEARADKEMPPYPYIVSTRDGMYYFKMVPVGDREEGGKGYVYSVGKESDQLLYETSGWYAYRVFLSNDCAYLCRVGNSGRTGDWWFKEQGSELRSPDKLIARPPEEHVALAFYHKGEPIKTYYVSDLVPDREKLQYSLQHFSFFKGEVCFFEEHLTEAQRSVMGSQDSHGYFIVAKTIDDKTHVFNMRTGEQIGDAALAKALDMTEDDAQALAVAFLQKLGPEWSEPVNCKRVGDFQYTFYCRDSQGNSRVLVDRRTGTVRLVDAEN